MLKFVLKDCDLGKKLLFNVIWHPGSVAASRVAPSA
jgi:hypothetical protein